MKKKKKKKPEEKDKQVKKVPTAHIKIPVNVKKVCFLIVVYLGV